MMISKIDVDEILEKVFDPELAQIWWDTPLPGLGMVSPIDLWRVGKREMVIDYARGYLTADI